VRPYTTLARCGRKAEVAQQRRGLERHGSIASRIGADARRLDATHVMNARRILADEHGARRVERGAALAIVHATRARAR
jgi:hypothetical protein